MDDVPRPAGRIAAALRVGWIAARLGLVLYFGRRGALFFYQGF